MAKLADAHILMLPDIGGASPTHWLARWAKQMSTGHIVDQKDWQTPIYEQWLGSVIKATQNSQRSIILIGQGLGANLIIKSATQNDFPNSVKGAFLVQPKNASSNKFKRAYDNSWTYELKEPLPFPSMLISTSRDKECTIDAAMSMSLILGSNFHNAGDHNKLNEAEGFGPWPEGLWKFASLMKRLQI